MPIFLILCCFFSSKVEDEVFPAHKYIVFSRAEGLRDIVQQYQDKHIYLNYEGLTSKMFELILKYIYEDYELTLTGKLFVIYGSR